MTNEDRLQEYAQELDVQNLSLLSLINSHRFLRSLNLENRQLLSEERLLAKIKAESAAYEEAMHCNYFSKERLKEMKIEELIAILGE